MDAIPDELTSAARAARERMGRFALATAEAGTSSGRPATLAAMASAAREAIFADALTAAIHARLEELKNVAK